MSVIQIILVAIAVFGFGAAVASYRRGNLGLKQMMLWTLLWGAIAIIVIRPETASEAARRLGVGRGADVVVYLSIAALFYLQFRLFARVEDQERQITRLARELALKDLKE